MLGLQPGHFDATLDGAAAPGLQFQISKPLEGGGEAN